MTGLTTTTAANSNAWDVIGSYVLQVLPGARFVRYSCPACFRGLWASLDDSHDNNSVACSCWADQIKNLSANESHESHYSTQVNNIEETVVISYDGIPPEYARPEGLPNIHLDTIFSPLALSD